MRATIYGIRIAFVALGLYWIALTTATHLPPKVVKAVRGFSLWNDKTMHFTAFAGLAFLLAWAIPTRAQKRFQNVVVAGLIGVVYALIDEVTQIPVGRTFDWADLLADFFGILTGLLSYVILRELILATSIRFEP